MRMLAKPTIEVATTFRACINTTFEDNGLKTRVERAENLIKRAATDYDRKGMSTSLHTIDKSATVGQLTTKEMQKLYSYRLIQHEEGRKIYDELKSVPYSRCPLCNQRRVSTLDHYLPSSQYPIFAITPFNLIPACLECNKTKLAKSSDKSDETSLHPYYDNIEGDEWLDAMVVEGDPVVLQYRVNPPRHWDHLLVARVKYHFDVFELKGLYGSHAAEEISELKTSMQRLYSAGGASEVKVELIDAFQKKYAVNRNSWQTAMFRALANSEWYHESFMIVAGIEPS